jgi:hypothetical protein
VHVFIVGVNFFHGRGEGNNYVRDEMHLVEETCAKTCSKIRTLECSFATSYVCIKPRLRLGQKITLERCIFWQRCTLNFLDRMNFKAKDIIGKITNLFCIYVFQIHRYID